jgi:chromosome segregation ATPase
MTMTVDGYDMTEDDKTALAKLSPAGTGQIATPGKRNLNAFIRQSDAALDELRSEKDHAIASVFEAKHGLEGLLASQSAERNIIKDEIEAWSDRYDDIRRQRKEAQEKVNKIETEVAELLTGVTGEYERYATAVEQSISIIRDKVGKFGTKTRFRRFDAEELVAKDTISALDDERRFY